MQLITFITEVLHLVTYVQIFYMIVEVNSWLIQCQLTFTRLVSMMHFDCKATPTNNTDDSCHIKSVEHVNQSYRYNIMPNHTTSY